MTDSKPLEQSTQNNAVSTISRNEPKDEGRNFLQNKFIRDDDNLETTTISSLVLPAGSHSLSMEETLDGHVVKKRKLSSSQRLSPQNSTEDDWKGPIVSHGHIDFAIVPVQDHLICRLCQGYFRDPCTVTECLHTFCKSCLFFAIQSGYRRCPTCDISLEPDPFKEVLSDRTLQELVNKIFPQLESQDDADEVEFYKRRGIQLKKEYRQQASNKNNSDEKLTNCNTNTMNQTKHSNEDHQNKNESSNSSTPSNTTRNDNHTIPSTTGTQQEEKEDMKPKSIPADELNFNLINDKTMGNAKYIMQPLSNHQLRSSGRLKVSQIKKFLIRKLSMNKLPSAIEILCNGDPLGNELSLKFVQRTRWLNPSQDLTLYYRLGEETESSF